MNRSAYTVSTGAVTDVDALISQSPKAMLLQPVVPGYEEIRT